MMDRSMINSMLLVDNRSRVVGNSVMLWLVMSISVMGSLVVSHSVDSGTMMGN